MHGSRTGPLVALVSLVAIVGVSSAWGGGRSDRRREVLRQLPKQPDLLINLSPSDLPSTGDLIRLGRRATPAVVNGLVNSMNGAVRETCAMVLTGTRDPSAVQALVDALDDPDASVRRVALEALGSVESRAATPRILQLLRKPGTSYSLKRQAVRALGRVGDPAGVAPLTAYFTSTWDPAAQAALWDLRRLLSRRQLEQVLLAPLKAATGKGSKSRPGQQVLSFAVDHVGPLRMKGAVRPLVALFPKQPPLQNRIVHALGRIGDRHAVGFLEGLLDKAASARLLNNVTFALQRLGRDPKPFLRAALSDRRAYIRFNAAFVAGDLKEKALVTELVAGLKDRNDFVRSEVAVALGRIAAPESAPALELASREHNPVVRRDALLALAAIDYERYRERVLQELVPSEQRSIRDRAIQLFVDRADATVLPRLLAALDPSDRRDRSMALRLIGRFSDLDSPEATAMLLRLASMSDSRHEALVLLGRFVDPRALFVLRQWLSSPGGEASQLLRALGRHGDRSSLATARRWLDDEDAPKAQLHAAFLLASLGESEGVDRLTAALEEAPVHLKRVAATLMTELDLSRVAGTRERLVELLAHPDVYVRLYAARPLLQVGEEQAAKLLRRELGKKVPFVRDEVLDLVERAPAVHRGPLLERWLGDADPFLKDELERIAKRS